MARGDANVVMVMDCLGRKGPIGIRQVEAAVGLSHDAVRHILTRYTEMGIVATDRSHSPIQYSVHPSWAKLVREHFIRRDELQRENGKRLQAQYPGVLTTNGRDGSKRVKAHPASRPPTEFDALLAACVAERPSVRTTWRGPAPQWAGV